MKNIGSLFLAIFITATTVSQSNTTAKLLLDAVSVKMGAYENMRIRFSQSLSNEDAGINEGDELPLKGEIYLQDEKYRLDYLGNQFIFDGKKLFVINRDEKEISISDSDLSGDDGFIYPSKLLTFYKEGYTLKMGNKLKIDNKNIQFVTLNPIDSAAEIIKVELGIDLETMHIYKLLQTGTNKAKTTFTITEFESNQKLPKKFFYLDREKYLGQNYTID